MLYSVQQQLAKLQQETDLATTDYVHVHEERAALEDQRHAVGRDCVRVRACVRVARG